MVTREMTFSPQGFKGQTLISTLISIVPFPIDEFKPGLIPGAFHIDASDGKIPQFTQISECIHYVYIDESRGNLRVLDPSYDVAAAIVSDFNVSQLGAEPGCHPGIFWALGDWDWTRMQKNAELMDQLATARQFQNAWFNKIVMIADDDWNKTRAHYAISDTQRYAAKLIDPENKTGRPWIFTNVNEEEQIPNVDMTACPACIQEIPAVSVICRYCKYILDETKYAKMRFASSGGVDIGSVLAKSK